MNGLFGFAAIILAERAAGYSTCLSRKVGAVLARDGEIIATGWNAVPTGLPPCKVCARAGSPPGADLCKCMANHAEENAIYSATSRGKLVVGATIYCTHQPCARCSALIVEMGIEKVIYKYPYAGPEALAILHHAGVSVEMIA